MKQLQINDRGKNYVSLIVNFLLLSYKLNKKVLKPITIDISGIIYIFDKNKNFFNLDIAFLLVYGIKLDILLLLSL